MKRTLALILLSATLAAHAAPRDATPAGFAQARQQFFAGVAGNSGARDEALDAFHAMAIAHPGHPLLLAYEGSALALQGRDAYMPWSKMKLSEKGANLIERALQQLSPEHDEALIDGTPESIEVRLVAANTLLALPEFMHRRAVGQRAVDAALAAPAFAMAKPEVKAGLYAAAGRAAALDKRPADEISFLRKAVAAAPASHDGVRAAARLKELGQ